MAYQRTSEALKSEVESTSFNIEAYLAQRDKPGQAFTMVEIGHGGVPVVHKQPHPFTGDRAYIGLETWMRGSKEWVNALIARRALHDNIFYMHYEPGGEVRETRDHGRKEQWYAGPFDTRSLLPDEAADEVFVSNVFCDPFLAHHGNRTERLLAEIHRILNPNGVAILRETITPNDVNEIDKDLLEDVGLRVMALETIEDADPTRWDQLEARYNGETINENERGSYYLFLAKR